MCVSIATAIWATVPGCSATNRFVTVEAAREQVANQSWMGEEGLLGLPLPCHYCGRSVRVSSAALYEQHKCLPKMVLHHSVLRKILPEALSHWPRFHICFCPLDASVGKGEGSCGCCNSFSQNLLVTQLLTCKIQLSTGETFKYARANCFVCLPVSIVV